MGKEKNVTESYKYAKEVYSKWGIDTDKALEKLKDISISIQCWQGDDVTGFENLGEALSGGIQVTGNYLGKARNPQELRQDLNEALSLIPGKHKVNLHAIYLESDGEKVDRNQIKPKHFERWVEWAKEKGIGLDFNPTFFSHPYSKDGLTLSHPNNEIRNFWIEHGKACRKIGEYFGKELNKTCITNIWIPDGYKDTPIDRLSPRERLKEALDEILKEKISNEYNIDSVESKLFGIGSESYVVGSHEFYMGYAIKNNVMLTLDSGHFHPTESIADKISSILCYIDKILLHVSRPVRWDSDHVVIFDDELNAIMNQVVRGKLEDRVYIALDYFDASINRVAAWVIGARNTLKAILKALLEPTDILKQYELEGNLTSRLAIVEELKTYPFSVVWDYYCLQQDVPLRESWLDEVKKYEIEVLSKREQ